LFQSTKLKVKFVTFDNKVTYIPLGINQGGYMFSFHRPQGTPQNHNQAITQREQASMESLRQAFGPTQTSVMSTHQDIHPEDVLPNLGNDFGPGIARVPAANPQIMRPDVSIPKHIAPSGHEVQEHNIWENCPQGRFRRHSKNARTLHQSPYLSGSREVDIDRSQLARTVSGETVGVG